MTCPKSLNQKARPPNHFSLTRAWFLPLALSTYPGLQGVGGLGVSWLLVPSKSLGHFRYLTVPMGPGSVVAALDSAEVSLPPLPNWVCFYGCTLSQGRADVTSQHLEEVTSRTYGIRMWESSIFWFHLVKQGLGSIRLVPPILCMSGPPGSCGGHNTHLVW